MRTTLQPPSRAPAGSGPSPELDGENIAFGQVLDGWDALTDIAAVPVIKASDTMETYNKIAQFFGDDRAARAKSKWGRPLKAIVITGSGIVRSSAATQSDDRQERTAQGDRRAESA